jgi:hypothetical protein
MRVSVSEAKGQLTDVRAALRSGVSEGRLSG